MRSLGGISGFKSHPSVLFHFSRGIALHGALDPVIAHRCGLIHDLRSSVRFFAGYIIVVALVVLFWLTLPPASLPFLINFLYPFRPRLETESFFSVALRMERLFWDYRRGLRQSKLKRSLAS